MNRKDRFGFAINYFQEVMPSPQTELDFSNTYELLVAVILSAQCTDKRINLTTPALFKRYPDIQALAKAEYEELFSYIKSVSCPGNKTRHLMGMAQKVVNQFKGEIPMTVDELVQ